MADTDDQLTSVLVEARRLGLLGPGPVPAAIAHARRLAAVIPPGCRRVLDLGAGGGLPGLVIATDRPELELVLLDASERRTTWLHRAVARLGLTARAEVVTGRAQDLGRNPAWRATIDAVVARGFGPPSLTAECAAPLLRAGGVLIVSEPPDERPDRWDERWLRELGLQPTGAPAGFARFEQVGLCPDRFPRRRAR